MHLSDIGNKEIYIDIMELALEAYGIDRAKKTFAEVRKTGLKEHGFPRLTANIGILLAKGRVPELRDLFAQMMDFCMEEVPAKRKVANDFSVRELCSAIFLLRENQTFPETQIQIWIDKLTAFQAQIGYDRIAESEKDNLGNWAAYNATSEFLRGKLCSVPVDSFVERQVGTLLAQFDRYGCYEDPHCPILYDYATRVQLASLLYFGYHGRHRSVIEENLRKAGFVTLKEMSVTGEIPFGGRSNQFLFNEAYLAGVCEFEASYYQSRGDGETAKKFKGAAVLATEAILDRIKDGDIHHVKNFYEKDSQIGCEGYAYFNKYMITLASFAYLAYLFADNTIALPQSVPEKPVAFVTDANFHKIFAKGFGYALEFDTDADFHYDANGLGRIHKAGLPGTLCLSSPFTVHPNYKIEFPNSMPASICAFVFKDGMEYNTSEKGWIYTLKEVKETGNSLCLALEVQNDGIILRENAIVDRSGVLISLSGEQNLGFWVPVFAFDGKDETSIMIDGSSIAVAYKNGLCRYLFDGTLLPDSILLCNRNGRYRLYKIQTNTLKIEMTAIQSNSR